MQKVRHQLLSTSSFLCFNHRFFALQDRKYFDSGDYAMSKAGVGSQNAVGTAIPNPEKYVALRFPR
jgi:hypothetical protein